MEIDYPALGKRIKAFRREAGLSQALLAEFIDVSPQYISHIETARKKASLEMLVRIANALDVTLDQLIADNLACSQACCDTELYRLISGCTAYERRVILDIAMATRYILEENLWILNINKS